MAKTEKTEQEHEEQEVEKLVKPSPKKKPPRTDREKRRIKTRDTDMESKDKDLSMNYKDIGGSSRRVLMRYLLSFKTVEPGTTLADLEEPVIDAEPALTDEQILEGALELYGLEDGELVEKLEDPEQRDMAQKALSLRLEPVPPDWDPEEVFVDASIRLKDRGRFRAHMQNWDAVTFAKNINFFKERKLNESLTTGREDRMDYFDALLNMATEAFEDLQTSEGRALTNLREALHLLKNPEDKFVDTEPLEEAVKGWKVRLKRTSAEHLNNIKEELEFALREDIPQDTNLYHWLNALKSLIHGATAMQDKLDPKQIAASLKRGMSKEAQYRGAPGYIPRELLPDAPKWSRPDPREITSEDYSRILMEAVAWLNSDFLKTDLLLYNPNMACRIALDYAIYDLDAGKFQSRIDAPTYEKLVGVLQRVLQGDVEG